jgi:hypothetical protein
MLIKPETQAPPPEAKPHPAHIGTYALPVDRLEGAHILGYGPAGASDLRI